MSMKKIKEKNLKYKNHHINIVYLYDENMKNYSIEVLDLDKNCKNIEHYTELFLEDADFYFNKIVKKYSGNKKKKRIPEKYLKFAKDYSEIFSFYNREEEIDKENMGNFAIKVFLGKKVSLNLLYAVLKPFQIDCAKIENWIIMLVPFYENNYNQCKEIVTELNKRGYKAEVYRREEYDNIIK